jgi:hypothetical protein
VIADERLHVVKPYDSQDSPTRTGEATPAQMQATVIVEAASRMNLHTIEYKGGHAYDRADVQRGFLEVCTRIT